LTDGTRLVARPGNAGQLFHKLLSNLPFGDYRWTVQTIDGSFQGSAFAPEGMFSITNPEPTMAFIPDQLGYEDKPFDLVISGLTYGAAPPGTVFKIAVDTDFSFFKRPLVSYSSGQPSLTIGIYPLANLWGERRITVALYSSDRLYAVTNSFLVTVQPVDDSPTAFPQLVSVFRNAATPVTLKGSDLDGDMLSFRIVTTPTNGALSGEAPNLTYTPATNFVGGDSFRFEVSDGVLSSLFQDVTIQVIPRFLLLPAVLTSNSVVLRFEAEPNSRYSVESSFDLIHWSPSEAQATGQNGILQVEGDVQTTNQFYRVIWTSE
jgi:hypothetical protein